MKKRIYLNFIGLILLSVLLFSISISLVIYNVSQNQEITAVKEKAMLITSLLNRSSSSEYANYIDDRDTTRISIIASDGTVLFDNKAEAETMENHSDREEFIQAIQTGRGEAKRYSKTLGVTTYYYAVKLNDGAILRVSKAMNSIAATFTPILPTILLITAITLVIANSVARRLTDSIIEPLNTIDFDNIDPSIYDELLPLAKKIDQQKRKIAEQFSALKNRTDTIEAITRNMKEGLALIDKNGIVLTANKSIRDIFRIRDAIGISILQLCRVTEFQEGVKKCLNGANPEIIFKRDNKIFNVYFSPVYHDDKINGALILFFDTTDKYKAEIQRREFSANVSHELKTPLTTILAVSDVIGTGMAKKNDIKNFSEKIAREAERLLRIIDDIIRLAEFDEGNIFAEFSKFDLYELAANVITGLQEKADEKQVSLRLEGEHVQIRANRRMLDELLYNLLDNGIKYNKNGGQVTVNLAQNARFCKITITDTGIGIPDEHIGRIFERFYRVDQSRSKKTGGTGLGLSIAKHIIEHHHGHIDVESQVGVGTTITCYLALPGE